MASNLRVDSIVPATGTNVAIGTAGGGVNIPGVLTYEDVTNVDSIGIITARSGIKVNSGELEIKGSGEGGPKVFRDQGSGPDIVLHGSRGTIASPTASGGTDLLGNINFAGYDGSAYHRRASINGIIDGAVGDSDDSVPTAMIFRTGTTTSTERLRITSSGQFVVGTNPTVNSGNIVHIEAPTSFNSGETIVNIEGNNAAAAARLVLHNNNTGGSAYNEILGSDAGGQSTSSIRFYNTDQSNNYGEIAFGTRNASGAPPVDRMRISKEGYLTKPYQVAWCMHGSATQTITGGTRLNFNVNGTGFGSFSNRNHGGVNTSNNSFTAPVTGLYSITVTVFFYTDNNTNTCSLVPFKNNVAMSNGNDTIFILGASAVNANITYSGTVLLQLNANDKIDIRRRAGEGGNSRVYLPHSYFAGFLVG